MTTNNSCNFDEGVSSQVLTGNGTGVAPTFQNFSSGGVMSLPPWVNTKSSFYWSVYPFSSSTTVAPSINQTYLIPFINTGTFTVTAIGVSCTVFAMNDTVRLGIYTASGTDGSGAILVDFGTITVTGLAFNVASSLSQSLTAGLYYMAVNFNTSNNTYGSLNQSLFSLFPSFKGMRYNNAAGTLPSTITQANVAGSTQASNLPVILLRGHT